MKPIKKELYVSSQQLRFHHKPQTAPEAQAVVREFKLDAPAGYQQQNAGALGVGNQQGTIPAIVQYGTTAGEVAQARRGACVACSHFDNKAWRRMVDISTGPLATAEDKQTVETLRQRIAVMGVGYLGTPEGRAQIDEFMNSLGICRVLSDWVEGVVGKNPMFWPIVPAPDACCPTNCHAGSAKLDVVTPAAPMGFFKPKDLDAVKVGDKRYDEVLRLAEGKKA